MSTADLERAFKSISKARPDYDRADNFYTGSVEEFHASASVKRMLRGLTDLDNYNFAHIAVDAVADKLYMNARTTGNDAADAILDQIWDENEMGLEAPILHRNTCKFGDAYAMIWPSVDEDGEVIGIDIIAEDPTCVRVFYDAINPRKKTHAIKTWCEGEKQEQVTFAYLYYADRVERWYTKGKAKASGKNDWKPFTEDGQEAVLENPLGFVPFYHFRTDRPYGVPEHKNAYGPQLTINKIIATHVSTIDYQSFPQRYSLAETGTQGPNYLQGEYDPFDIEQGPTDGPESLDDTSQLEADPGTVWGFQNTKAVGQFEAASADAYLKPFDRYVKAMSALTATPMHEFDSTGDAVSGSSRRATNASFYAKVQARRDSIGFTWGQLLTDLLGYLGIAVDGVDIVWTPMVTAETAEDWNVLKIKHELGLPVEDLFLEAGYPPEKAAEFAAEAEKRAAEAQKQFEMQQEANNKDSENPEEADTETRNTNK